MAFVFCNVFWELNSIKLRVFFEKSIGKKQLRRHDKNYHYFCKSNISVINLIVSSKNMNKVSKNMSLWKIRLTARVDFTKYRQVLSVFYCFWMGRILENCWFFEICWQNTTPRTERFTEKWLELNFTLHFISYLSIALFKILPHSKTKNDTKLSVFIENDSCCSSNFLQTHIF